MPLFLFPVLLDFNTVLESSTRKRQQACLITRGCSPPSQRGSPTWDDLAWAPLCALCWDADSSPVPFCFCSELHFWGKTRLSHGRARSADVLLRVPMSLPVRDAGLFSFRTGLLGFCWSHERTWGVAPPQLFSRACVGLPYSSLDVWCHCWSHLRLHILSGMVFYILLQIQFIYQIGRKPFQFPVSFCLSFGELHLSRNLSISSVLSNLLAQNFQNSQGDFMAESQTKPPLSEETVFLWAFNHGWPCCILASERWALGASLSPV